MQSWFLTLFLFLVPSSQGNVQWSHNGDEEIAGTPYLPCSANQIFALTDEVRALFPLKNQVDAMQKQLHEVLEALKKTKKHVESLEAAATERISLREEAARLRTEVASCSSKTRTARTEMQSECVGKVLAVSNEAQREILAAKATAEECLVELTAVKNFTDTQKALLEENKALRLKLDETQLAAEECQNASSIISSAETLVIGTPLGRGGRGASDPWQRPKPSPGKQESSAVSKIPPSTYKQSCKGFLDPTPAVGASPMEVSIRIGNRQYLVGKNEVTWGEAWRLCKARGMWILSLESEQEQQQLEPHMMHMHNTPTKYWLFARKPAGSAWYNWECASHADTEPWRLPTVARPGTGASVRCANIELHTGSDVTWGDDACDTRYRYICRKLVTEC